MDAPQRQTTKRMPTYTSDIHERSPGLPEKEDWNAGNTDAGAIDARRGGVPVGTMTPLDKAEAQAEAKARKTQPYSPTGTATGTGAGTGDTLSGDVNNIGTQEDDVTFRDAGTALDQGQQRRRAGRSSSR